MHFPYHSLPNHTYQIIIYAPKYTYEVMLLLHVPSCIFEVLVHEVDVLLYVQILYVCMYQIWPVINGRAPFNNH